MTDAPTRGEDLLRRTILFRDLDDDEIAAVLLLGQIKSYPQGSTIFVEGSEPDSFYIIYEGSIRISKIVEGAGEEALAILNAGDFFGEMALIERTPRSAHALAHTDLRLLELSIPSMLELLDSDKILACKFLWSFCRTLSGRLRDTSSKVSSLLMISSQFR